MGLVKRGVAAGTSHIARLWNVGIVSIDKIARRMGMTMSKLCPLLIIGASGANPRGGMDCLGEDCQLWDAGSDVARIGALDRPRYLAGCGLMPRESRRA